MKLKNYFLFYLLTAVLCIAQSCKDDDDNGPGGNQMDTFTTTCCEIPHLEGCIGGAEFYLPNAFTPNGDGINDIFYVLGGIGIKEVASFKIFDGAGNIVFEDFNFQANDPANGWDGRLTDGTITDGVYSYTIVVINLTDETSEFEGSVCCRSSFPMPCVDHEQHCAYAIQHNGNGRFDPALPNPEDCE